MEIPDNLARKLESKLSLLMSIGHESDRAGEWVECSFCGSTSDVRYIPPSYTRHVVKISHNDNCLGVSLQRVFEVD